MEIYDVNDIQEILHIKRSTAYKLMGSKGFPSIKIGRKYIVRAEDLEKFLDRNIGKTFNIQ